MFRTLDDLKGNKDKDNKDKNDKKQTESYTGGEKSGLAVENPDHVDEILKRAREDTREMSEKGPAKTNCKITLYKQGFTVDDGPLRPYKNPENAAFMEDLKNGYVPSELRGKYKEGLDVGVEDKRAEEYKEPPPPKYIAYSGAGTSLGGEAPLSSAVEIEHNVKVNSSL